MGETSDLPASLSPMAFSPMSPNAWLRYDLIQDMLGRVPEATSFLEVGCGMGALAARLVDRYDYVGYEPDSECYRTARSRIHGRGLVIQDALPATPTRLFAILGAFEVLEHLKNDQASLVRWREWIEPEGHIVLSVPAHPERFGAADVAAGHYRRYKAPQLASLLGRAGFDEVMVWSYGFPLGYVLESARNFLAPRDGAQIPEVRTSGSGRFYQPSRRLGWATRVCTAPFRIAQRPFKRTSLGTGLVAMARRPA